MSEATLNAGSNPDLNGSNIVGMAGAAFRHGAADASAAAARAWEGTALFLSRLVYTASYTISYGVVFPSALLARSIPKNNAAVRGLIEGAHAAVERVDHWKGASPAALTDQAPAPS